MKHLKHTKLNQGGFGWHVILPIVVVVVVGVLGLRLLLRGHAATPTYANGAIYYSSGFITPDGRTKASNAGFSSQATFSPDGTQAAYANSGSIITETVGNPGGFSNSKTILPNANAWSNDGDGAGLSWSADGQWIAFGVGTPDNGSFGYPYSIGLVHPDGTGYTTVPNVTLTDSDGFYGVSWLPDSQTLLYMKGGDQMCTVKIDGTGSNCVTLSALQGKQGTDYLDPQVSPDGAKVLLTGYTNAYETTSGGEAPWTDIYEVKIDGTGSKQLTTVPALTATQTYQNHASGARWSPDGTQIAYGVGGDPTITGLYTMNADGTGQVKRDTTQGTNIAWQPVTPGNEPMVVGSCTVTGIPTSPTPNSIIKPTYTITNATTHAITVTPTEAATYGSGASQNKALSAVTIAAGASVTLTSQLNFQDSYVAAGTANATVYFQLTVAGKNTYQNFLCKSSSFALPVAPATGYCQVESVPTSIKKGATLTAKVQVYDTSISPFTPTLKTTFVPNTGTAYTYPTYTLTKLIAGANTIKTLPTYTVSKTTTATSATVKASITGAASTISCSATTKITT